MPGHPLQLYVPLDDRIAPLSLHFKFIREEFQMKADGLFNKESTGSTKTGIALMK